MTVLLSGAYGFIGQNLSHYLTSRGDTCWALDLEQKPEVTSYSRFFTWDQLAHIPWSEVDAVIHLAGKAHDTKNTSDPQSYFTINTGLTQKLFDAVNAAQVKVFVLFSSVKACADTVHGTLTEDATPAPATPYGQSKLAAEEYLSKAHQQTKVYILRPAMIHGPGNKGNLNLLYGVASKGCPWPLGAFTGLRSFCSIDNICATVQKLCEGATVPGVYQVADDTAITVNRLIELIAESVGKRARIWHIPAAPIRLIARIGDTLHLPLNSERLKKLTESYVVANTKLKAAFGWQEMPTGTEAGLRKTLEAFRQHERLDQ